MKRSSKFEIRRSRMWPLTPALSPSDGEREKVHEETSYQKLGPSIWAGVRFLTSAATRSIEREVFGFRTCFGFRISGFEI